MTNLKKRDRQSGQAMVLGLGLLVVAIVMVYFVMNSGRAVNSKINLVNAADAAAYSGAQITARQLNFMAYTNRAMIANEVSIGHMFSYQMELDLISQVTQSIFNLQSNVLLNFLVWIADFFVKGDLTGLVNTSLQTVSDLVAAFDQVTDGITGMYSLAVDANNAFYLGLQKQAFQDFAYPEEGRPLVEAAMAAVIEDYEIRGDSTPISINDPEMISDFADAGNADDGVRSAATQALTLNKDFCRMIMFVKPTATVAGEVGAGNQMDQFCEAVTAGSNNAAGAGSPAEAMNDNGAMLEMLRSTVDRFSNAEWISERDASYYLIPFLVTAKRKGSTTVNADNGRINWQSEGDSLQLGLGLTNFSIPLFTESAGGNAAQISEEAGKMLNGGMVNLLSTYGLCGNAADGAEIDCASLTNGSYKGVQQYSYLNPDSVAPRVTAFLAQGNCSDNIGVDNVTGNQKEGWHNNLRGYESGRPICGEMVYAYAQAEVFFERPPCDSDCNFGFEEVQPGMVEKPNLFNPFWQARLVVQ